MARVLFLCLTIALVTGQGCPNPNPGPTGNCPAAKGGDWSDYAGEWTSITNAAGDKFQNWGWMEAAINSDGTFSGICYSYEYDYTWWMPTGIGDIPISVYNPAGVARQICGAIDFDAGYATVKLEGYEALDASLEIHSSTELALVFSGDFPYTVINVDR